MATTAAPPRTDAAAPPPRRRPPVRHKGAIVGFLAPFAVLFTAFYVVPIAYAVWQSFFTVEREGTFGKAREVFGGLTQYQRVLTDADFWGSIGNVAVFFVLSIPLQLGLALVFALLLDSPLVKGRSFFRLAFFAPYAVPGVIAAIMWGFLYSPGISPFPQVADRYDLLGPDLVVFAMVNVVNWVYTGYNMLIIYSALQSIPRDAIEAATIDGAGQFRIAWSIKIPAVAPALILTGVFSIIGTLQLFNEPKVFRSISSAVSSDYTPNLMVDATSNIPDYHLAAAMSVVLALITCTLSFTFLKVTQKRAFS
ncbi:multiple sugar transport system permease protein [Mumia flava]|uniref:Multiple sugar transport system permease protein n=1 Tax=Mumia flava TaxID=1348852 RepID=A0A0B2BTX4_9ACTN|nr:sugar ABC transporter permease [Mumia flava]PJJ57964.1 multiple sugar transport system permease protein [Mumia flava]